MARGYPGILYPIPNFPHVHVDIERMDRESMRRYLRYRLRAIDAQLRSLGHEREGRADESPWNPDTMGAAWDRLLEIDYLDSMREAIVETLAAL